MKLSTKLTYNVKFTALNNNLVRRGSLLRRDRIGGYHRRPVIGVHVADTRHRVSYRRGYEDETPYLQFKVRPMCVGM
ncbi:Hypothetical protein CINCED_3A003174 [Cinara cedri]|uniref:Uncharacterized protein n=1 Tax=Cinara cedri TaxID=506608 RepID=A0A5E4M2R6_9HEMI|nr:Hypothetical protein CINCED_3A003174 [Cinara cedri]